MPVKENRLFQILKTGAGEGSLEQLEAAAELVKKCLSLNGEDNKAYNETSGYEIRRIRKENTSLG